MQLIYFSAVPWASFAQRPHEFVHWAHERLDARVLWVEPYPVRFPMIQDFSRPAVRSSQGMAPPPWLELVTPHALPVEPAAWGRSLNRVLLGGVLRSAARFAEADSHTVIVVGKPSDLALQAMKMLEGLRCVYDAMDDFPAFHEGSARATNAKIEREIVARCAACSTSSSYLADRLRKGNVNIHLVPNGLASQRMPDPRADAAGDASFGYIGTLGAWFDWQWIAELAQAWPSRRIEIHGPVFRAPDVALPANVKLGPALPHDRALRTMATFAAGLIPFQQSELTQSVDPVKYYEYRGLGLPVISTPFGEMRRHAVEDARLLLTEQPASCKEQVGRLLGGRDTAESVAAFRQANAWDVRFEPLAAVLGAPIPA
ncbi:MAG TPA: glycosyl transferase [Ramlibacter sp.]|nr:glycosyl transferase [Ramlibacter sp.]